MNTVQSFARPAAAVREGHVLVVDDDDGMRDTLVEILTEIGYGAAGASNGVDAVRLQAQFSPDVALVDQRLPDTDGIALGTQLKRTDPDLTVLLVTGYASLDNAIAAVWELDGYLTKPVPPAELVRVVRAGIESAQLRQENRKLIDDLERANKLLEHNVAARTSELSGLQSLTEALAGSTQLDDVLKDCVRMAWRFSEAQYAGLYLCDDETSGFRLQALVGDGELAESIEKPGPGPTGGGETVISLTAGGSEVGAIVLGRPKPLDPMFIVTLAGSAAIAIQNAQRFGREHETVEKLSELSRIKSTFLAFVTHELRNPLAAVIGYAEVLKAREGGTLAEQQQMVDSIISQAKNLSALVNDLLDATRAEFSGFSVRLQPTDVEQVVEAVGAVFREAQRPVFNSFSPDLPMAQSDPARLEQIVSNLVANAIKHSPAGSPVQIKAEVEGDRLALSVIDQGKGIEPGFLPHLFELFAQASKSDSTREGGLGIGLYIVKGLVEAMGATIEAHSELGKGSEFIVRLPLAQGDQ